MGPIWRGGDYNEEELLYSAYTSSLKLALKHNLKSISFPFIAFYISLMLNLDETIDLLQRSGYALSPSSKFDLIVEFFIGEENYDIYEINEALFSFKQKTLGV